MLLIQKPEKKWETRPLDCWAKAKELRAKFYQTEKDAKQENIFLIAGGDGPQQQLGPGFGNIHLVHPHPEAASSSSLNPAHP